MTCQIGWAELTCLSNSTILKINSLFCTLYRNLFDRRSPVEKKNISLMRRISCLFFFLFPFFLFLFFSDFSVMCTFLFQYGA